MTKSTITRERLEEIRDCCWMDDLGLSMYELSELASMALAAMDSESGCLPLDYLQGHKDGLEWAAQLAEANHPETGDWLYDDPIELAKAIRKGPDMPPAQPVADSEPVIVVGDDGGDALSYRRLIQSFEPGTKLYRHAQQPVVPDAYVRDEHGRMMLNGVYEPKIGFGTGRNACRAAMLQAGTLTNEGTKQAWAGIPDIDNAINMLDRIDTLESCDDDRIEAVKTVLRGLAGNSQVIPDGYVMVPKEPTERMVIDGFESEPDETFSEPEVWEAFQKMSGCEQAAYRARLCWAAMLAAAPQSPDSDPATVPGKWIPVSEQMPEVGDIVLTAMGGVVNVGETECSAANCRFFTSVISGRELPATHWMQLPAAPQEVGDA
ncbi:DUF551 domain-containing protein [Klebsiella pneumoniae]|nr:DUF551 domain-containing protein [Klebsiella pneumoniae]MDP1185275.1 DUF551 domain-containing protein [Klebsiella pneumoniae]